VHHKNVAGSRGRALNQGVREAKPPEAETLLAFGRSMKAANLLVFSIWKRYKLQILVLSCKNDVY